MQEVSDFIDRSKRELYSTGKARIIMVGVCVGFGGRGGFFTCVRGRGRESDKGAEWSQESVTKASE